MLINEATADYLYSLRNKTEHTRRSAKTILSQFVDWCTDQEISLEQLKPVHIRQYTEYLHSRPNYQTSERLSSSTLNMHITRIKTFLTWLNNEECYAIGLSDKAIRRIELPRIDAKVVDIITPERFKRLYAACAQERFAGTTQRNRAILFLLADTGIRAAELCSLTLDCVFFNDDDNFIRVLGKGRKQREVGFGDNTRKALRTYILRYRKAAKNEQHVFISHKNEPLTPGGIDTMLYTLADKAGISRELVSAHKWRHTFAVTYLRNGGDVYKLSRPLGHASVDTTEKYLRAFQASDARQGGTSIVDKNF
jgi:site-specific recombinase XerD